ncbi:MAG: hypothetical protein JF616_06070 [Fibrobacteres bacterium]|nr:hypothetical protein [Fibrobacterota bacterium]
MKTPKPDPARMKLAGTYLIRRLIVIEAICFAALIVFISIDDEWLIPKFIGKDFPIGNSRLAGLLDTIWVACLFILALYIQMKILHKIRLLEGMMSVCASCKKIRDGENHWSPIEEYIQKRSHADFTHTICPDCGVKLYGDLYVQSVKRVQTGP